MITDKRSANAVGGKTARACDSCLRRRARWYCTADEAFLCQACDTSVHSANQLASRHERVRLETSSSKQQQSGSVINQISAPSWHQGFTRKARTPRNSNNKPNSSLLVQQTKGEDGKISNPDLPFVPEIEGEDASPPPDERDDRISYRVPVFDRFDDTEMENEMKILLMEEGQGGMDEFENFPGFLPSDLELAEFAADVESLLGGEFEENTSKSNGLGRLSCEEKGGGGNGRVKVEEEEEEIEAVLACQWDYPMAREAFEWDFDPTVEEEEEEKVVTVLDTVKMVGESKVEMNRNIVLKLNYEGVITAWANQGSPWTTGIRPEFNLDDCWPDFMDVCPTNIHSKHGDTGRRVGGGENNDGAREARVSRYREKRRTRLFSKKIRYEVRKLNAEKRPRMKGRFVKRTSFTGPTFPNYLII